MPPSKQTHCRRLRFCGQGEYHSDCNMDPDESVRDNSFRWMKKGSAAQGFVDIGFEGRFYILDPQEDSLLPRGHL